MQAPANKWSLFSCIVSFEPHFAFCFYFCDGHHVRENNDHPDMAWWVSKDGLSTFAVSL